MTTRTKFTNNQQVKQGLDRFYRKSTIEMILQVFIVYFNLVFQLTLKLFGCNNYIVKKKFKEMMY